MANFLTAIDIVLAHEGSDYTDDPNDAGGPTKFGLTIPDLAQYYGRIATSKDVQALCRGEAINIYLKLYWAPIRGDEIINDHVATVLFDQGVLRGLRTITLDAQKVLVLDQDGILGNITLGQINDYPNQSLLAFLIIKESQRHLINIVKAKPSQIEFLEGWLERTNDLIKMLLL